MVSIWVNGVNKTGQISDWEIWWGSRESELMLTCRFPSGKSFYSPLRNCKVEPTVVMEGQLLSRKGGSVFSAVEKVTAYGGRIAAIQYPGNEKTYIMNLEDIELCSPAPIHDEAVFVYFTQVARARVTQADASNRPIAENVERQLQRLLPHDDSALNAYCTGQNRRREGAENLIFPFGLNDSQLKAVERAFSSQVSLIEGPPGTGKTQTILNILANILLRGRTVAIVSNNNPAVDNVYEKLGKAGLAYLAAKLGSEQNRTAFFNDLPTAPTEVPLPAPQMEQIQADLRKLKELLHARESLARLQAEIDELTVEQRYLQAWQRENVTVPQLPLEKYGLSPQKSSDLMAYLTHLAEQRIKFRDRIDLLLNFRIFRVKPFGDWEKRKSVIYALQLHYYEKALQGRSAELASYRAVLEDGKFEQLLASLSAGSMAYLKQHLHQHLARNADFNAAGYKLQFDEFVKRFPIIGSSTHSIVNSLAPGALLDYVIIDEASQQDIVPGILALGCARNLIIVGDRKQLPHIPVKLGIPSPMAGYDCERYSLLDSNVSVFGARLPTTLLKEHYRCHPRIIQFCNQQFYDNQLLAMTRDTGGKPLQLVVTAKGNHTRRFSNRRELDSLLETGKQGGASCWDGENSQGFISPYNAQVALARGVLPADVVKDTVHKFQGRECNEMIFSTVLDKKAGSQRSISFVDDPHLVNVAVSRAKNKFTLVTGDDVFAANNGHIAALVRYIEYYAEDGQIRRAPVISAFDLLYKEYDRSLERLNARLRSSDSRYKSEQIMAQILREALSLDQYHALTFHSQIALIQLASPANGALTARELQYMKNRASCDFVLYFKVGKTPLGVIEVDGGSHDLPKQMERDLLKESILSKAGIPLLRLKTVESGIEEKVAGFLSQWAMGASSSTPPLSAED